LLTWLRFLRGIPKRHNVVEGFVNGRQFHQLNGASSPTGCGQLGFHPKAWAAIVIGSIVLIMIEVAVALKETKPTRIFVHEGVHSDAARVDQRSPNPFTGT